MATLKDLTRPWEIWLVQHTHVDIGYTEPQDIILRKHPEFVAQALDYCAATEALPPGERFCWTCEVAWTVKAFLARYPERAEEFFRRVREGRIEVTGLYLQLTDLFTKELIEETTDYAMDLARQHGFEVVTAMNDDVNGWAWGLPAILSARGIRYFDAAINETRSLGVRPRPRPFWWVAPGGERVLFWHGTGYLHGNRLGLNRPGAEERIAECLQEFEQGRYPHHIVQVRIHGQHHDNAPPGLWISQAVHDWNASHTMPKLRLITPRAWFEEVAAHWPEKIVEHRAGWPDWWADGNGTAAVESALVRSAQADLEVLKALAQAVGAKPAPERVERARDAAAFFCEHTWGAWCSTDAPQSLNSKAQWNVKAGFAYTAAIETRSLVDDMLAAEARKAVDGKPGVLVFNPLDHPRSDMAEVVLADVEVGLPASSWTAGPLRTEAGPAFHLVDTESDELVPVQAEPAISDSARRPGQRVRFVARNVPAGGFRRYRLVPGELPAQGRCGFSGGGLESPWMKVVPAADGAGIASTRDCRTGLEWVRSGAEYVLGEVVYEAIPGPFGREKLAAWSGVKRDCPFIRTRIRFGSPQEVPLPFGAALRWQAKDLPGSLRSLSMEAAIYDDWPGVDLRYRLEKIANEEAEALYVAFPLAAGEKPEVWLDVPGAAMRPGLDQVPGTATDWHGIQHGFAVAGGGVCAAVASPDIPLVQVNGINTGKWLESLPPHNGVVMSWVLNNYWFTNFPAAQGGLIEWRYSLLGQPGGFDRLAFNSFTSTVRYPLRACLIPVS